MSISKPVLVDNEYESNAAKLWRKTKAQPFVPLGLAGTAAAVAWGAYAYRSRPAGLSTSRYVMHLRVTAQSVIVGAMIVGAFFGSRKSSRNLD
ncbi:HIG1 domain family member 1A, mitochondrial-like [Corticium candelabrum]|uniref:HIG1 domain family member 1A, mitochondrial-like n=1 Tax=Corticium candelabrum TaxID=121492 RepID=UPI002E2560AB|nr:HIG1 domain family member 1A, mitochondrial-like [Corticium candelabrum]